MSISTSRTAGRRRACTERLDLPASGRVTLIPRGMDRESVSRFAEAIARFLGTGRYLAIQTCIVIVWIALNIALPLLRWDPYPFILLNLAFSTQAAYAAPLILLAQNRQDDRDRASLAEDRAVAVRMREDTEFLAREIAALRLAQSDAATRQYMRGELAGQLESLRGDIESLVRDAVRVPPQTASDEREPTAARSPSRHGGPTPTPGGAPRETSDPETEGPPATGKPNIGNPERPRRPKHHKRRNTTGVSTTGIPPHSTDAGYATRTGNRENGGPDRKTTPTIATGPTPKTTLDDPTREAGATTHLKNRGVTTHGHHSLSAHTGSSWHSLGKPQPVDSYPGNVHSRHGS
ncbi:putative membrane protein [Frankia casuarinae]|uniref:DUF1003 domain-containing protein n=2 Tax=Frankia casuarinae (strain DSM 45818 / CECT 9043 / HFP020203 / CcI3) TaxID=106370 RepID=Q2JF93_FRACC|nr:MULTISPECIES: DUF1003 domain-containing protein [Frankia]ABD10049.1 protein of unknown function DUF1003 [Frankia casuarinae]ETA04237.1 putative membrane protein [Frankia sp. CcI6]EYT92157.1 putative membrane protein [Frankia casuarinae]KDA45089.1 putative membrane protein [Frankia sp. BMG5.23]TFE35309.1 DUF1003 domain-containing protein [Frankia sp. B2]